MSEQDASLATAPDTTPDTTSDTTPGPRTFVTATIVGALAGVMPARYASSR